MIQNALPRFSCWQTHVLLLQYMAGMESGKDLRSGCQGAKLEDFSISIKHVRSIQDCFSPLSTRHAFELFHECIVVEP